MQVSDLFERRYVRPKLIERMAAYGDDPTVFVTFTNLLKAGINPEPDCADPIGIYTYPVGEMMENFENLVVPYAGNRRFCYFFKATGNILELQHYTEADLDNDIVELQEKFWSLLMKPSRPFMWMVGGEPGTAEEIWTSHLASWLSSSRSKPSPGHTIWWITFQMARRIARRDGEQRDYQMVWNTLFRTLGYDIVADRGGKIISRNEPHQAVFLHIKALKVLEAVPNDLFGPPDLSPYERPKRPYG